MNSKLKISKKVFTLLLIIAALIWASGGIELSITRLIRGIPEFFEFIMDMFPPNLEQEFLLNSLGALRETIQIAILGTSIGFAIVMPLSLSASKNIGPKYGREISRGFLNVIRSIPSILWALMFVVAVGLGPFSGVLAVSAYSIGFLGKLLYEGFEDIDMKQLNAIKSAGATKLQTVRYGVIPQATPMIISHTLYMFEYNVRASAIVGIVGAGGIGRELETYLQLRLYSNVGTLLLLLIISVLIIDFASAQIRTRYLQNGNQ